MPRRQLPLTGAVMRAKRLLAETADREAKLPMHEVADAVSRSPFHLARSFRQQTGLSLHQYRQHLRSQQPWSGLSMETATSRASRTTSAIAARATWAVFRREVGVTLGEVAVLAGSART